MSEGSKGLITLSIILGLALLAIVYAHYVSRVASAHVFVYDANGRRVIFQNFCIGLESIAKGRKSYRCGVSDGETIVGAVPRGAYDLSVWFGDLEHVDYRLAQAQVVLDREDQRINIRLHNVRQDIDVHYTLPGNALSQTHSGTDVCFTRYEDGEVTMHHEENMLKCKPFKTD